MTGDRTDLLQRWNHYDDKFPVIRVLAPGQGWPSAGPGWALQRETAQAIVQSQGAGGDCLLIESGELVPETVDALLGLGLPLVVGMGPGLSDTRLIDAAAGFVLPADDVAVLGLVFAAATAAATPPGVREFSETTNRTINALSEEAARIAAALTQLAAQTRQSVDERPIDAAFVRRLIRVRRDRERFFPAEMFADPAWDMLLDLAAARLEGKSVPVSSLCIAAAVPTTTALRWIRSLTEAGIFERRIDPGDARRTYISLSDAAAEAMFGYLRLFSGQFGGR
jgi:hypothetical protein